ncbi:hypothetical protein TREMEDRAFT_70628 [Tremella mesenterica DSM 1558]|uniref:uncharacterized protein n=1 Tax=Tremella mesenterica (strain ATCC 24925 / CBS 8224 / DSM 1558 / NBRC 9311 / NRRL Y-6157 / RJB 2259-6 / UBC 559-6) TaxID=578456 RepID=UPI0003F4A41C|nr:uncharacterized protein TREMEDRAFT_70628 [Tremella mesenterica DSM 1558]EIW72112.1 hypothetical protein TREMEDRAFT_70628 [Tremella mesenterica DSM 1558]
MGLSGYESDKSSAALSSGVLDMDDEGDDDGRSLTRQLAETAQGVREMSRELGRTKVHSKISHVLIVTKARDNRLIKLTRELALFLMQKRPILSRQSSVTPNSASRPGIDGKLTNDRGMVVYVDAQLRTSKRFDAAGLQAQYPELFQPISRRRSSSSTSLTGSTYTSASSVGDGKRGKDEGQLRYWTSEMCSNSPHLFDFVITLGGDGTVLFTSWLFQKIVPPVLPFALGSLGFLTNFDFSNYKATMDRVVEEGIRVNLRMRFTCTVYRAIAPEEALISLKTGKKRKAIKKPGGEILMSCVDKSGWEALEGQNTSSPIVNVEGKDKEIMCFSTRPVEQFEVLNDLVVDRGPSPYVSLLELFGDEHHLTTVQADGLTVSTPTGSTAYSLSAGGSLVHPQIPAILITPICPHTLSFRPMLLPDGMELRICVPYNSRSTAWASFDGRGRVELKQGDHIKVTASKYPFPTVCADKASTDWFQSISRTLRWNEREKQKSFVVVEEEQDPPSKSRSHHEPTSDAKVARAQATRREADVGEEEDETSDDEDEEDEDEQYDIDDKSGGEATPSSPSSPILGETLRPTAKQPTNELHARLAPHLQKSGVSTPDRYVTHGAAPPPLSQRHLIEALAKAKLDDQRHPGVSGELREKDGEQGQRDDIRSDGSAFRVDGTHRIPHGRGHLGSPHEPGMMDQKTARPREMSRERTEPREKAKAFAFFGHDDSASDLSDGTSE